MDALRAKKRGRRSGEQAYLQGWQCATIVTLIRDNMPDQLKMAFVLWTRAAVRDLIEERFGITLALTTMGNYLRKWNFTPQKPIRKAFEQKAEKVREWIEVEYPEIAKRAKEEGATIFWCDETKVTNEVHNGRSYAPKGKTPVVRETAKKIKINMISAMTNRGEVRFMTYTASMTQNKYILFLARLVESAGCKVCVIADNLSVHHGKKVKAWVEANPDKIALYYIPAYAPELNPDELLNRDLKKNVHAKKAPRCFDQLKASVLSFMKMLQRTPGRVAKYFSSKKLAYCNQLFQTSAI
jgi:transposase